MGAGHFACSCNISSVSREAAPKLSLTIPTSYVDWALASSSSISAGWLTEAA